MLYKCYNILILEIVLLKDIILIHNEINDLWIYIIKCPTWESTN